MRPYRIHQALFFGVQTFRPLLERFYLVFLFHIVYFPLNLGEVIDPEWERFFLAGYLAVPAFLFLRGLWLAIRETPRLVFYLEEKLGLDFRLVNALSILNGNFSDAEKRKAESGIAALLAPVNISTYLGKMPLRSLAASGAFAAALVLFHAVDHRHWKKFLDNTESILRSGSISLSISYPKQVREGDAFQVLASGDFSEGLLQFRGATTSGEAGLTNALAWSSGPLNENVKLHLVFRKGRLVRETFDEVRLFRRPEIGLIETSVVDAATGETLRYKGATRVEAMPGSRAAVRFEIQDDQRVSRVSAESLPAGFTLSRESNRVYLSASPVRSAELKLQIENDHGLLLTTPLSYAFLVRENAPPTIVIRKPGMELRLEKKESVNVEYTAEDDIALDSLKLKYWTQSPNVSRILAEGEIQIPVPKGKNASRQLDGALPLPLENIELLPGHWLSYVLEVRDIYGLGAVSTTNVVRLLSLSELFAGQKKTEESIASALRSDKQEAEDIRREAERLSVLREQGKMDPRQAENLASRISQFRNRIQEETEKVRDFQKNLEGNPELFSPEVLEKFKKIEEAYRQIDRDLLRKMEEEFRALVGPTPNKDIQKTAKDWDPKTLTERLDNLLRTLESTKALQETDALEKMAENLYQKYEDLKAFTLAENKAETFDKNKKEIGELLKELRDQFQKKKDELFEDAKTDPELKDIQKRLEQNLSDSGQKRFDEYKADEKNLKDLDQFSKDFDALRKDFQLLSRRNRELDLEATVAELNRQIRGFLFLGSQAGALQRGEVLDPDATDPDVVQRELIHFLSDLEGHTEQGRAALYDKIAGYLPGITGFFEIYKQAVEKNRSFQKQLDPSGPFRMSWRYPQAGLGETKLSTLELARHLILLKGALKEQDEAQQNANAMQNGEARQKKMGQRAKRAMGQGQSLSESQKGYLREMAREQAAIRSLMEAAKARMEEKGSGKNGNENGGQNQAGSEALKSMEKLIESMKRAEEGLQNATEKDRERIVSQQKEIEENLLKFNKGIRDRKDEEKNERESNTAKSSFDGTNGKIDESLLYFQERLGKLRNAKYFPPGYEARMRAYLEKLKEKKADSGPTAPVR